MPLNELLFRFLQRAFSPKANLRMVMFYAKYKIELRPFPLLQQFKLNNNWNNIKSNSICTRWERGRTLHLIRELFLNAEGTNE